MRRFLVEVALPGVALALVVAIITFLGITSIAADAFSSHLANDCKALTTRAAISTRAAELCTGELVACQMTFEQVQAVLADQQRAKEACQ